MSSQAKHIFFGPHRIPLSHVFFESEFSYGLVNLKPIMPGHVMIIPKRVIPRFAELTEKEAADLSLSAWKVAPRVEKKYGCSALNIAIQDGKAAGQSVPHVHVHLLPRKSGDLENNDEIYEKIQDWDGKELGACKFCGRYEGDGKDEKANGGGAVDPHEDKKEQKNGDPFDEANRRVRTDDEMTEEAMDLRKLFEEDNPVKSAL